MDGLLTKKRPLIMGVLNVTPDSFSDGGRFFDPEKAVTQGLRLVDEGADIIDVGGESTRPGSDSVDETEEKRRVLEVIEALAGRTDAMISVDTVKPGVAREAVVRGARMVNDVSMLRDGDELARVAAEHGAELVIMHSRKSPKDMQQQPGYDNVIDDVIRELQGAVDQARAAGVGQDKIWLDPGIGFAKTASHNIELLAGLRQMVELGYPVLVGPSRKSFIGAVTGAEVDDRMGGTAAAVTVSILAGARAVRVHDAAVMRQAALIAGAIAEKQTQIESGKDDV